MLTRRPPPKAPHAGGRPALPCVGAALAVLVGHAAAQRLHHRARGEVLRRDQLEAAALGIWVWGRERAGVGFQGGSSGAGAPALARSCCSCCRCFAGTAASFDQSWSCTGAAWICAVDNWREARQVAATQRAARRCRASHRLLLSYLAVLLVGDDACHLGVDLRERTIILEELALLGGRACKRRVLKTIWQRERSR